MKKLLLIIFAFSTLSAGMLNNFSKNLLDTGLNPGLVTIGINPGFGQPVSYQDVGFSYEFKWQITKFLSIVYFETPHKRINEWHKIVDEGYTVNEEHTLSPMYHTINDLKIRFHFNLY